MRPAPLHAQAKQFPDDIRRQSLRHWPCHEMARSGAECTAGHGMNGGLEGILKLSTSVLGFRGGKEFWLNPSDI